MPCCLVEAEKERSKDHQPSVIYDGINDPSLIAVLKLPAPFGRVRKQNCPEGWTRSLDYRRRVLGCTGRDGLSLVVAHSQAMMAAAGGKRPVSDCHR